MKSVKLTMMRYGRPVVFEHDSVLEAARDACSDVETNEAAPYSIEEHGSVVWKNDGPHGNSYDKLRELAKLDEALK